MPKIKPPLTDKFIKGLKAKEKEYKISDGKNLFIRVLKSGKKVFEVEYKSPLSLKMKRVRIGEYPLMSLAMAREVLINTKKELMNGNEPFLKSLDNNFKKIALEWLEIKENRNTLKTAKLQRRMLENWILPDFENRNIESIKKDEIIKVLRKIEANNKLETLKRIFKLLNQIYKFSSDKTHNIIADIDFKYTFKTTKPVNFPTILEENEIRVLYKNIDEYSGSLAVKIALKLSILTAMRPFNIRSAKWSELDLNYGLWNISSQKMKMKKDFIMPLALQTINLLKNYKDFAKNSEFVFLSLAYNDRCMSENTINMALRRMGYDRKIIVAHGFRAMFSSLAHEHISVHKQNSLIIEKCLAHTDKNTVRAIYNRSSNLNEMRFLMQWWADFLYD